MHHCVQTSVRIETSAFEEPLAAHAHTMHHACARLQDVKQRVVIGDLLLGCAMAGQEVEAVTRLKQLPLSQQESFIRRSVAEGQLRTAVLAVRALEAHEHFPDVEGRYHRHKLRRLLDKGVWGVAAELAGSDADAQVRAA